LLTRAHQAIATLERYKRRLDEAASALSALEIEDRATIGDIAVVAQRLEMVSRVTDELRGYLIELGTDGGLLGLQLEELTAGTARERDLLLRDYGPDPGASRADELADLSADELLDPATVVAVIGLGAVGGLGQHVTSRGYRLLGQIPRLPQAVADDLIEYFGGLQQLLSASAQDLRRVAGMDPALATSVREGLSRLAESTLMERYA